MTTDDRPATDRPRLIETAFPLEQTSIDSVHEKNVRHGHISTLHIWPARRPLAACRAALIATLLPDPGTPEARRALCERIGGKLVKVRRTRTASGGGRTETREVAQTVGGVLHWGRERENKAELDALREEIRVAYGGRSPRVLDPFAGGGAIPLEAMRLGCEATAIDINPVAWFLLKCTLEYPQRLAGQKQRLPEFALRDGEFMAEFLESQGLKKAAVRTFLKDLGLVAHDPAPPLAGFVGAHVDPSFLEADLAWFVRAWGRRVLALARKELADRYPVYAAFEPLHDLEGWRERNSEAVLPMRRVPTDSEGVASVDGWNEELAQRAKGGTHSAAGTADRAAMVRAFLGEESQPRWIMKPTVAYLWARTVRCKNCRATIPLLKTRWLAKKADKRALLEIEPTADRTAAVFRVRSNVPSAGGNNAIRREHDRRLGQGTMSRAGAWCPCCGRPGTVAMEMEDIRQEGLKGRLCAVMTAVVVEGPRGKEYRLPTDEELSAAEVSEADLQGAFRDVPFGIPEEPLPGKEALGIRIPLYGFDVWRKVFSPRQLVAIAQLVRATRSVVAVDGGGGLPGLWVNVLRDYLTVVLGRAVNYMSSLCIWDSTASEVKQTFLRFALPITWDFAESNPLSAADRYYAGGLTKVARVLDELLVACQDAPVPTVHAESAIAPRTHSYDVIVTDPPYYGAIPYSDLMDFFYIWFRRATAVNLQEPIPAFAGTLSPKWNSATQDGELVDDPSRHGNDPSASKSAYENGMARAFASCAGALRPEGRLVIVFANKSPDAWETLVSAIVRAGFYVDGSWPIQTEMRGGIRNFARASLASSVWLVCKKRGTSARAGWDRDVLQEMRSRINEQLRTFWDAGIRGPDFVWAATGPALAAYSKHPAVKKADRPNELMTVAEFLRAVRRIVVDFVVGRVLSGDAVGAIAPAGEGTSGDSGLDDVTTYYLLHRHDFGMDDAPAGACILYAVSCNLSESDLADRFDVLARAGGGDSSGDDEEESGDPDAEVDDASDARTGSAFRLKTWRQRLRPGLGVDPTTEAARARRMEEAARPSLFDATDPTPLVALRPIPLVDKAHRLMHLWEGGDLAKVSAYIEDHLLRRNTLFHKVLQALLELSPEGSDERRVLEVVMNHFRDLGVSLPRTPVLPGMEGMASGDAAPGE